MIKVEGYKMFRGTMRITPKCEVVEPFEITGDWLYKPDANCWYSVGRSFCADICEVVRDETEWVHAHWIPYKKDSACCSACGYIHPRMTYHTTRFCEQCGALMDEEV